MKRFSFGVLIAIIGLMFSLSFVFYAAVNPGFYNEIGGILGSVLYANLLVPLILSLLVMLAGVFLCWHEAYQKK